MNQTIEYYNANAEEYCANTTSADTTDLQNVFLSYLNPGSYILDFGCGSGRDTRAFQKKGYRTEACDGSLEMCALAEQNTGEKVRCLLFQDLDEHQKYDGIWACASLLHLRKKELADVLNRMAEALRENGVAYLSFKYGDFEGVRGGRYFTDLDENGLDAVLQEVKRFRLEREWVTHDVRKERGSEQWLNAIVRRLY